MYGENFLWLGEIIMQKGFVFVLALVLTVIIVIFAVSNSGMIAIDFIFTEVFLSQAIVIFVCVLLGAIIASILGWIRQGSLKKDIKHLKTENKELQFEVYELMAQIKNKEEYRDKRTDTFEIEDPYEY